MSEGVCGKVKKGVMREVFKLKERIKKKERSTKSLEEKQRRNKKRKREI